MKKQMITLEEYQTRIPKTNETYIKNLDEKSQESYMMLYNAYSSLLIKYFIKHFNLKEYDDILTNSELSYPKVSEKDMDIYQYQASNYLNYIYIRNNLYIERLSQEEHEFLLGKTHDEDIEYDDKIDEFIGQTFKKVMLDNITNENVKYNFFGPDNIKFMKPDNAIIIGLRYDDYFEQINESVEEWDLKNQQRIKESEILINIMKIGLSKNIGTPVEVIKYNEFSIKKRTQ